MPATNRRILVWAEVDTKVPYCRQHVLRLEGRGEFPQRVQIGPGRVGWWSDEVDQWLASRTRGAPPQREQLGPKAPSAPEPDAEDLELLRRLAVKFDLDLVPRKPERRRGGGPP
jgi:prophage regulatory protein